MLILLSTKDVLRLLIGADHLPRFLNLGIKLRIFQAFFTLGGRNLTVNAFASFIPPKFRILSKMILKPLLPFNYLNPVLSLISFVKAAYFNTLITPNLPLHITLFLLSIVKRFCFFGINCLRKLTDAW
ncbi:hypothetical protein D3C78_1480880 [compost metagenome]